MEFKTLHKDPSHWSVLPNLMDYTQTYSEFSWDEIQSHLEGLPNHGGINIAHETVDRYANSDHRDKVALRWIGKNDEIVDYTYGQLKEETNRFANVLNLFEISKGDRVAVLSGRIPALYIAALGILKNRSVFCPLFSAFGPEPIFQRLSRGDVKILVTTKLQYKRKIVAIWNRLPNLKAVLLTDVEEDLEENVFSLPKLMENASSTFTILPTGPEDMCCLHFTSGTTGMPKGAMHVHNAVLVHYMTAKYALDLHPEDIFWCTADPGWVTGTSYGIFAPLLSGVTNIIDEAEFDADRWYRILQDQKVSVWYTAPTAIRRLMRMDIKPREVYDLSHLRFCASVGEPLNPEAVVWGNEVLNLLIHDNWWQTETGGIMISNYMSQEIRPGSMGLPLPGITAAIVHRLENGKVEVENKPSIEGELALKPGWPSMFRGYINDEARYQKCFAGGWYITGDLAERDEDGYYWFISRADDIINTSGHLVGPFEVESALMEYPAVAEVGVIGKPDPFIGEVVKAFVALKPGYEPSATLQAEISGFSRKRLGSAIAPKEIEFVEYLPKTRSGKIMRRLLKSRELGLPEGDVSTLEAK